MKRTREMAQGTLLDAERAELAQLEADIAAEDVEEGRTSQQPIQQDEEAMKQRLPFQKIPFDTPRLASIAAQVIAPDKDMHPERAGKAVHYTTGDAFITIVMAAHSLKMLRTISNSMFESLIQVQDTITAFDP